MENEGHEGINALARVFQGRTKELTEHPPTLDYGAIQGDMSLLTNNFPLPIPQSDYTVCRSVTWGAVDDVFYKTQYPGKANSGAHAHGTNGEHEHPGIPSSGEHDHPADGGEMEHSHATLVGDKFRWLMPGDRVLVAWVADDPCVIDLILPATSIG